MSDSSNNDSAEERVVAAVSDHGFNAVDDVKNKMQLAIRQVEHMDEYILNLRKLYRRADRENCHAIRYNLRMELAIASGVRKMYHRYIIVKRREVETLSTEIPEREASAQAIALDPNETAELNLHSHN